jgi:phosphoketolase
VAAEALPGMSGQFAVREIGQANEAIETLKKRRQELRDYVGREGNDPPEILDWTWHRPTADQAS